MPEAPEHALSPSPSTRACNHKSRLDWAMSSAPVSGSSQKQTSDLKAMSPARPSLCRHPADLPVPPRATLSLQSTDLRRASRRVGTGVC